MPQASRKLRWWLAGCLSVLGLTATLCCFLFIHPAFKTRATKGRCVLHETQTHSPVSRKPTPFNGAAVPEVKTIVQLMEEWKQKNPVYHAVIEISGKGMATKSEVFNLVNSDGEPVARIKTHVSKPAPMDFIVQVDRNQTLTYFPFSNQVVDVDNRKERTNVLVRLGWTGGVLDADGQGPFHYAQYRWHW
jgi:hypothetical protein